MNETLDFNKEYKEILDLNKKYTECRNNGRKINGNNFQIISGDVPILLSAPHAVKTFRGNDEKPCDKNTGGIVEYLCQKSHVYGITRIFNDNDDPNYYNEGSSLEYKKAIIELINKADIKIMFDIHGCSDGHGFGIEIGTNHGGNLRNKQIAEIVSNAFSKVAVVSKDTLFKASLPENVSNYVHAHTNIDCIQIEICHSIRNNSQKLMEWISVFSDLCQAVL